MQSDQTITQKLRQFSHSLTENGFHFLAFLIALLAFIFTSIDQTRDNRQNVNRALQPEIRFAPVTESFDRIEAQNWLSMQATDLVKKLHDRDIHHATVYSRVKAEDSAREKAAKKGILYTELNDLYGMRVVMDNELDVYEALNMICSTYPTVPGTIKNYIVAPKASGYQSVHVVAEIENRRVEFQLRTHEMHRQAEAEHEAYKARMRQAA